MRNDPGICELNDRDRCISVYIWISAKSPFVFRKGPFSSSVFQIERSAWLKSKSATSRVRPDGERSFCCRITILPEGTSRSSYRPNINNPTRSRAAWVMKRGITNVTLLCSSVRDARRMRMHSPRVSRIRVRSTTHGCIELDFGLDIVGNLREFSCEIRSRDT